MIHIHTRWLAHDGPRGQALWGNAIGVPTSFAGETEWGTMWSATVGDSPGDAEREWLRGPREAGHLVMIYELSRAATPPGVSQIIGVASPYPIDTAAFLEQIRNSLAAFGLRTVALRADLAPQALSQLAPVQIQSVRVDAPEGYILNHFSNPVSWDQLVFQFGDSGRISAVTAMLGNTDPPTVVNLFDDNQFYIADPAPQSIGQVATRISPLWGASDDQVL